MKLILIDHPVVIHSSHSKLFHLLHRLNIGTVAFTKTIRFTYD